MIHYYASMEQVPMITAALEEVTDLLYTRSPFSKSSHQRIDSDLQHFLQAINQRLHNTQEEALREEYILGVISYQFLAPLLGVDVEKEKKTFVDHLVQEYKLKDPLSIHFTIEGGDPNDIITIDSIVESMKKEHIFQHKTPQGLRQKAYSQTEQELRKLEHAWTEDQTLITTGYLILISALKEEHTRLKERFDKATKGYPTYALMLPIDRMDAEE